MFISFVKRREKLLIF